MSVRPVILGGYAAKTCPRATHNTYDETVPAQPTEVSEATQRLFDLGNDHEAEIFDRWLAIGVDVVDLREHDGDKPAHIAETLLALEAGRGVILGGRLPDDVTGGRGGKPDILLRASEGGYHPGDVKAHLVLQVREADGLTGTLELPFLHQAVIDDVGLRYREPDLLQLAHYWRMLQACGHAANAAWGAIIGTEGRLAWYDLNEQLFRTFSRSQGKTRRSSLERYDHEHDFRARIARAAQQRTGASTDPDPLVVPIGQVECIGCSWAPVCIDTLDDDDLSAALPAGKLSVREYLTLRDHDIRSLEDLTDADLTTLLASSYGEENSHLTGLMNRLTKARIAAELTRLDVEIRMKPGATFEIPRADVEIDLDIEWDRSNRVYLWGALVTEDGGSEFVPFLDLAVTDEASELAHAQRCFDWITRTYPGALVYHYSAAEKTQARRILGERATDYAGTAADPESWIDLWPYVRDGFDGRDGLGLKTIATAGAGFTWRDEDPGGLQSQDWLTQALVGHNTARQRILDYNEDDVRATLAVRRWLGKGIH